MQNMHSSMEELIPTSNKIFYPQNQDIKDCGLISSNNKNNVSFRLKFKKLSVSEETDKSQLNVMNKQAKQSHSTKSSPYDTSYVFNKSQKTTIQNSFASLNKKKKINFATLFEQKKKKLKKHNRENLQINVESSSDCFPKKELDTSIPELNITNDSHKKAKVKFKPKIVSKHKHISSDTFKSLAKFDLKDQLPKQKSSQNQSCNKSCNPELTKIEYDCFEQRIKNQEFDKVLSIMDHLEYATTDALKVLYKYSSMCEKEAIEDVSQIVNEYTDNKLKVNGPIKRLEKQNRKKMMMELNLKKAKRIANHLL